MVCDCDKTGCNAFNNLSFSVLVIDKDYNVLSMNNKARELLKAGSCSSEKIKCYALTHQRDKNCCNYGELCPVKECFETKLFSRVVHKHIYNGTEVFVEVTATPVLDENGEIKYVIEELRDISKLLKLETVINSLRSEIQTLQGIIPICSSCKKVRDDEGFWSQVENYISTRSGAKFSHSLCPDCLKELYPDFAKKLQDRKDNENSGT